MKLQSLRALVAIVDYGTFSEAALELGTSQSSISHAIAELEAELGVRLLDRGRFGALPTEVGERVVAHARRMEGSLDAIRQEAALELGSLSGTLRISSFRSAGALVLPQAVAQLGRDHPSLKVDVQELPSNCVAAAIDALHAGTVDVTLTMSFLADDAIFWELVRDRYVAVVPDGFSRGASGISIRSLVEEVIILSDGPCSLPAKDVLVDLDPTFRPAYEVSEDTTILGMVAQRLGIAIMPELAADTLPAGVRRLELEEFIERRIGVALMPAALKVPTVRAFLRTVRNLFPQSEVPVFGEGTRGTPPVAPR